MTANVRSVIVAVDGSEQSMYALTWRLTTSNSDPLRPTPLKPLAPSSYSTSNLRPLSLLDSIPALSPSAGPVNVKTQVVIGDPKEKICEAVENLHADLLVTGCRAFGPVKR
ncbi:hypothetical protein GH714_003317 [Hevea brasiliensis]|uniref:UspA domain-containing protein n=1 Tax=Hevea brasiliensis TaxID=3981 RepID=A0A6A6LGX2_HEVBR|nr:hypothetical protein GH714_003317 [Hevea brasiliensis]